jgi:hypothetical protein
VLDVRDPAPMTTDAAVPPAAVPRRSARAWRDEHDRLLFEAVFPRTVAVQVAAERGLHALAGAADALPEGSAMRVRLEGSGIAGTDVASTFTWRSTRWLCERFGDDVRLAYLDADPHEAAALLARALDPMERDGLADRPMPWPRWARLHLGADARDWLRRLVALVGRLPGDDRTREAAWAALQVFVRWRMRADAPCLTAGRFGRVRPFVVGEAGFRRPAAPGELWRERPPRRVRLDASDRARLADLGRGVMVSLLRETDFFTWVDEAHIECHDVGRGTQVALYGCAGDRRLTLESYVGYLLLRNRVPVAYGGSWILGPQAAFGVNVLPPYRGGESTMIVCQLLRLYAWRFGLRTLRVEASQIGRDNRDGLASGSFWFYWRLGFRPEQPELTALAQRDWDRILRDSGGRPSARFYRVDVLRRLADAVLVWPVPGAPGGWRYVEPARLGDRVTRHVLQRFDGDRDAAQRDALRRLGAGPPAWRRMAVALAALAPEGGWSARGRVSLRALGRLKDGDEIGYARALARHATLCAALQRLAATDGAAS